MKIWIDEHEAYQLYASDEAIIFDCRGIMDDERATFQNFLDSHIKNSIYIYPLLTGDNKISGGRHPLPDLNLFYHSVSNLSKGKHIIAIDHKDGFYATRFLYLCHLVHLNCYIIDGSFENLNQFPLANNDDKVFININEYISSVKFDEMTDETINYNDEYNCAIFKTHNEINNGEKQILIDARNHERYKGEYEPIDPIAGHIPGAINIPFTKIFEQGFIKSGAALKDIFGDVLNKKSIVYCGSGLSATPLYAALKSLDADVALYAGSFSEWCNIYPEKIETGE
ncbi:hypothetical protein LAU42_05820 [Macrococcus armenti]|uniref:sulfurtransferase n=1 Tax=Macrococcus armenti TaxID=2875764 RepID=UPI001CCE5F52|nr:rhodanese-like domain-containing protein [Macrococcus armenti]UBH21331.1 hypothetical protein LAU42_05820 [Macrococcus armenti]